MSQSDEYLVGMLNKHEEQIKEHDSILKIHSEQIKNIENSSLKLENLVMNENRETRSTIMQTNRELHGLITQLLSFNSGQNELNHNFKILKVESIVKIVGVLMGSGGILYYIFS